MMAMMKRGMRQPSRLRWNRAVNLMLAAFLVLGVGCAQGQVGVDVQLQPGSLMREDLSQLFGASSVQAIGALDGQPSPPDWLRTDLLPILYGEVPDYVSRSAFAIGVLLRINGQPATRTLSFTVAPSAAGPPLFELSFRVANLNETQLLTNNYADLENAIGIARARLAQDSIGQGVATGKRVLFLRRVGAYEQDRLNRIPQLPNQVLPINNAYINTTANVVVASYLHPDNMTCASFEQRSTALFAAEGLQTDFSSCALSTIFVNTTTGTSRFAPTMQERTWKRSKDDFNKSIVPSAVIAAFIFFPMLFLFAIHFCTRSSDAETEEQMRRLVRNMMQRNRAHTMRVVADSGDTFAAAWYAESVDVGGEEVTHSPLSPRKPSGVSQTPSQHSRTLRYRSHSRPPTYRPPPKHDF